MMVESGGKSKPDDALPRRARQLVLHYRGTDYGFDACPHQYVWTRER